MQKNTCLFCGYNNRIENKYCSNCGKVLRDHTLSRARFLILTEENKKVILPITAGRNTIGRDIGNAFVLDDEQVSKYHAAVTYEKDDVWIEDLESKNGVYLNGKLITKPEKLHDGCLIKIGATILKFEFPKE